MRILLLEDDHLLRKHISKFLELKGNYVESYEDGEELLDQVNFYDFDFFIFDINVPNYDGFEILEYIKGKNIKTPIIFISAMVGIAEITKAFNLGCSDYLKKPFELAELELRINNIAKSFKKEDIISLNDKFSYDLNSRELLADKKSVILSKKQNEILYILIKNRGKVIPFDTITDYVWQDNSIDYRTISSHIRDIHKIIGSKIIKNVRGVGYKIEE
jgi:DNA-binding response OmpR family regulator